ncbi:MAG: hypothetical protein ABIH42_06100 [Planctomycetota bacterium]
MKKSGFMWECECGNIEYGEYPPKECGRCKGIESFLKVPEDLVEEREAENVLALQPEEDEEYEY